MRIRLNVITFVSLILLSLTVGAEDEWPTKGWPVTTPPNVGLDSRILAAFDADIAQGKYGYIDSMLVIRHGEIAYERYYGHDYGEIYSEESKTRGPLVVGDLTGPYNYFNDWWHPYYRDTMLHTMQSVTKSVTSVVIGIAVGRDEFPDLDTPVLDFFEPGSVANVDARKREMTITDLQEAFDWVQFTIDRPMAGQPGESFKYNSGATLILGHIFNLATGVDLEEYAVRHLFGPLGIDDYFWKRTPQGLVDTQEGLYVSTRDIAKTAYLIQKRGRWEGRQIVPESWVADSVQAFVPVNEDRSWEYGYKWWLIHYEFEGEDRVAIAGLGFGGQIPIALPELDMVVVFTGWNTLPDSLELSVNEAIERVLAAVSDE